MGVKILQSKIHKIIRTTNLYFSYIGVESAFVKKEKEYLCTKNEQLQNMHFLLFLYTKCED